MLLQNYPVLNRPFAFKQWLSNLSIAEDYILMAEPDHLMIKPPPNWCGQAKAGPQGKGGWCTGNLSSHDMSAPNAAAALTHLPAFLGGILQGRRRSAPLGTLSHTWTPGSSRGSSTSFQDSPTIKTSRTRTCTWIRSVSWPSHIRLLEKVR